MVPRTRDDNRFLEVRDVDIDDLRFDSYQLPDDLEYVDPVELEDEEYEL